MKKVDKKPETISGFKGFSKDLKCLDFQFEAGKKVTHDGEIKLCSRGFHFCEHPLDVFGYFTPNESRFAVIEAEEVSPETHSDDTKRVCKSITIKTELNFSAMISAAVKFVFDRADWSKKETASTVRRGAASATGYSGAASATGEQGCAVALGIEGKALGALGCWLTIAEWKIIENKCQRIDVQTKQVDGNKIKADTFYRLIEGKFTEVKYL